MLFPIQAKDDKVGKNILHWNAEAEKRACGNNESLVPSPGIIPNIGPWSKHQNYRNPVPIPYTFIYHNSIQQILEIALYSGHNWKTDTFLNWLP